MRPHLPERESKLARLEKLKQIRSPMLQHARDISTYLLPYAGRYLVDERNRYEDRYQDIIDETGLSSLEILEAGMMATRTSPARPWFRLQVADPALNKRWRVRQWLQICDDVIGRMFRKSNTYPTISGLYSEQGAFGTGAALVTDDFDAGIHCTQFTMGEYSIATDNRGRVNTLYREFQMTVSECVLEFGLENCSKTIKRMFGERMYDSPVKVAHAIEPRSFEEREPGRLDNRNMPWASCYFELGAEPGEYLRISGFRRFPCLVPRWRVTGGDFWGTGPGSKALGGTKQLQIEQLRKGEAIDYQTRPPLQVPPSLMNRDQDLLPGGQIPYDQTTPHGGVRPAFEVNLRLDWLQQDIEDVRRRIERAFFVPLFQPIGTLSDTTQRTAQEILQRREEMLTMLGPVTQRNQNELDEPLIDLAFDRAIDARLLPAPPEELDGQELEVEFLGPLAQALKAVEAQNIDRFTFALGTIGASKPEVWDRFNADAWVDHMSDRLGVHPDLVIANDKVAIIRQRRAQAEAAAAQSQAMAVQAKTARDLAAADTAGQNALTDVTRQYSGIV